MKRPVKSARRKVARKDRTEERLLLLAWKETLADMTPGLAHDLNNLLTGILALSDAYLAQNNSGDSFHEGLSHLHQKAKETSYLIHRMVLLHQEQAGNKSYVDMNVAVGEVVEILRRLMPRKITLSAVLENGPLPVFLDVVELRRVLFNLALTAVKSMPTNGKVNFQTSRYNRPPVLRSLQGEFPRLPAICLEIGHSGHEFQAERFTMMSRRLNGRVQTMDSATLSLRHASHFVERSRGGLSMHSGPAAGGFTFRLWLPEAI